MKEPKFKFGDKVKVWRKPHSIEEIGIIANNFYAVEAETYFFKIIFSDRNSDYYSDYYQESEIEVVPHPDTDRLEFLFQLAEKGSVYFSDINKVKLEVHCWDKSFETLGKDRRGAIDNAIKRFRKNGFFWPYKAEY